MALQYNNYDNEYRHCRAAATATNAAVTTTITLLQQQQQQQQQQKPPPPPPPPPLVTQTHGLYYRASMVTMTRFNDLIETMCWTK
jgi:hypothetical protein